MKAEHGSIAKIDRPSAEGILPRKRLFRFLDKGRNLPITWVSGPPGSGKTVLTASYLDARKLPCLWYRLDEGDADIATFFYYMGLAAKKAAPSKRKPLPPLTPEYLAGIPVFTRRYFEGLYSRLRPPFIIIFDNYQDVPIGSGFHEIINYALEVIPKGINVFVLSRNLPPPQLARLRANHRINFLGWTEIRFTVEETRGILRTKGKKRLNDKALLDLNKKTEGWAAGLMLIILSSKSRTIDYQSMKRFPTKEVFEYFAIEIFEKLERVTQGFFLKTAFLPRMTAQIAEKLTGIPTSGRMLSELSENHYFTERYSEDSPVYRYHPLFREFLLSRARESFSEEEISSIQRHAAQLLEESAQVEDAAELFRDCKDWERLIQLILVHSPSLISQGRSKTLQEWIEGIPEGVRENIPWLLYWAGVCRLPFSPSQSRDFFEKAFNQFRARGDTRRIFLSLSGLFDCTIFGLGDFKPLDQTIALLDKVLQESLSFPSLEIEARLTANMLGALVLRQPQHPDFEKWAERGFSLLQKTPDFNVKVLTLESLITHGLLSGEFSRAESILDSFHGLAQSSDVAPLFLVSLKDLEGFYYWLTAVFEENQKAVKEGLELASTTGVHVMDIYALGHGAAGALSSGDMEAADALIKKMASYLDQRHLWGSSLYYLLSSWALLIRGDLSKALSQAELCLKFSVEAGNPQSLAYHHIGYALVLHELKREQEALNHLAESHALARSAKVPIAEFMCFLAEAQFAFDKENEQNGLASLKKALSIGADKGYVNTYYWRPAVMANLCKKALEAGIEVEYVQNLIRKRDLIPDPPPYEYEQWPWPLRIYTLGPFQILKDGKPVQFSGKVQKKPLEMLKALIALGGSEVKEEQLTDLFWPDVDGDAGHSNFTTTLSRLRRLLGHETAIKFQEGKATLDPHYCWVDAWAFERILGQTESILRGIDDTENQEDKKGEILTLADKTFDIYKGHFLPADEKYSWTTSYRERLRAKFIRLITRFGDYLQQTGQWEKAVEHYQRGLDVDEFAEEYYQHLMICYHRFGQPVKAIEVYRRCRKTLSATFEIEPSPKTQSIYQSIIKNMKIRSSIPK